MQKSSSFLSKPTVYESFVRSWSATAASSKSTSVGAFHSSPSSSQGSFTLNRSIRDSNNPASALLSRDSGFKGFSDITKGQIRTMASNQPLTQSTMPTASELKLHTSPSTIQTAPNVDLSDSQKVIVSSVLDLFAGLPTLRNLTLWTDNAIFNDPITVAEGRKQYTAQWYGLKQAFSSINRNSHTVTSGGNPITMDLSTTYKVAGVGTEKKIDSVIEIYLDKESGKISKVLDKWDGSIEGGGVKHAFRKLNAVTVPNLVSVPKSIEEEEGGK